MLVSTGLGPELASDHNVIAGHGQTQDRHQTQQAQSEEREDGATQLFHLGFIIIFGPPQPQ